MNCEGQGDKGKDGGDYDDKGSQRFIQSEPRSHEERQDHGGHGTFHKARRKGGTLEPKHKGGHVRDEGDEEEFYDHCWDDGIRVLHLGKGEGKADGEDHEGDNEIPEHAYGLHHESRHRDVDDSQGYASCNTPEGGQGTYGTEGFSYGETLVFTIARCERSAHKPEQGGSGQEVEKESILRRIISIHTGEYRQTEIGHIAKDSSEYQNPFFSGMDLQHLSQGRVDCQGDEEAGDGGNPCSGRDEECFDIDMCGIDDLYTKGRQEEIKDRDIDGLTQGSGIDPDLESLEPDPCQNDQAEGQ